MTRAMLRPALLLLACGAVGYVAAVAANAPQRIALTAKKFSFSAHEIHVKKGKPVTFAVTAVDFVHGFSIPELGVRMDLVPGKTVELTLTPDRAGEFIFLCDNFCGDGHENMNGTLIVTED